MNHDQYYEDRKRHMDAMIETGYNPYGSKYYENVDRINNVSLAIEQATNLNLQPGEKSNLYYCIAGRIKQKRVMGKLAFLTIRDSTGDIQIGISKSAIAEPEWTLLQNLDLGDIIGTEGYVGKTKTGEITIWSTTLIILSKCLRTPPDKHSGLTDIETRYRQRYLDLFTNPDVMKTFKTRSKIINSIRQLFIESSFIEVETPMLQPMYGGAAAQPFTTHHNSLDMDLYLRISPELYLKRLLVGGMERVFEINRNFRNEGISTQHNPEFTMLECYLAYGDLSDMKDIMGGIIGRCLQATAGNYTVQDYAKREFRGHVIDFNKIEEYRYTELLQKYAGVDLNDIAAVREKAASLGITGQMDDAIVINKLFEATVEENLIQPTFVTEYPAALCPLTQRKSDDPNIALRFEFYVGGMEIANAYTELNNPQIQRETFASQLEGEGDSMRVMDEDFLTALEYGMPPAGGMGVGIDRLVMLMTNSTSIRDVILFPLQRG